MPSSNSGPEAWVSALVVWITLGLCLVAWRCNTQDFRSQSDQLRLDGRLERIEQRLKYLEQRRP